MSGGSTPWGAYAGIADALRARMIELPPGTMAPSETTLAGEFGVVRNTVRRALAQLANEGLIETVPGRGRVVRASGEPGQRAGMLPTYRRIAADLQRAIAAGDLAPGASLPSESALGSEYGVSRGTVRQALSLLERDELIRTMPGKGRFVRAGRARDAG